MSKKGFKPQKCFCCGRVLEPVETQWAAGPVCYPCYWAAKFIYESGYQEFADVPVEFANLISEFFVRGGYRWPDDLIQAFKDRPFAKANVELRRWWSPKEEREIRMHKDDFSIGIGDIADLINGLLDSRENS